MNMKIPSTLELFVGTRNHQIIHQLNGVYAPIVSAQSLMWQVIPDVVAHGIQLLFLEGNLLVPKQRQDLNAVKYQSTLNSS